MDLSQRLMEAGNVLPALRGFFHGFRESQEIGVFDMHQMRSHLNRLYLFGDRLRSILAMVESEFAFSSRFLGYRIMDDGSSRETRILLSSAINQRLSTNNSSRPGYVIRKMANGEHVIAVEEAGRIGRELLIEDFRRIIESHCSAALNARAFQPICMMNIAGKCQWPDCRYLHASAEGMKEAINQRFSLFLHQILVINNMDRFMKRGKYQLRRYVSIQLNGLVAEYIL
jgi:hypothetical protein